MRKLLVALVAFTFFTMILGAWTRVAGAGLSCPDWPLCHGKIIPPFNYQIMLEYFHRLAAFLVSICLVVVSFFVFGNAERRKRLGLILGLALALLATQIIFGGLTVLKLLKGEIVATHLTLGFSFFGTLLFLALKWERLEGRGTYGPTDARLARLALLGAVFVLLQVILGGLVSAHSAGLACADFPRCQGLWFPGFSGNVGLHFLHRVGAVLLSGYLLYFSFRLLQKGPWAIPWAVSLVSLLIFQWLLAVTMIYLHIPDVMSVTHLAVAIGLFALLLVVHDQVKAARLS